MFSLPVISGASFLTILSLLYSSHYLSDILDLGHSRALVSPKRWRWIDITPNRELIWSPCFDGFDCARLDVPLDWLDPSDENRAVIAVIRLPASDPEDYKGPIFTNPGGPGGSGVSTLRRSGKFIQQIVGKNHDIISFDPRGVGASLPQINCWKSTQNSKIWNLQDVGVVDSHPGMIYDAFARSSALSGLCETGVKFNQSLEGEYKSPMSFTSTVSVARDMLEIMNRGGWEKLRYWGFSYGTYLGGVFASMWPEKVERLVSDGNVDYSEWSTCSHINFLHDADKVMDAFYHYCHKAGPSGCAFYSSNPQKIEDRLNTLLQDLKRHPVIVPPSHGDEMPELVSYSSLKRLISAALYRPILLFPSLAHVLARLETGDGRPFVDLMIAQGMRSPLPCECQPCGVPDDKPDESEGTEDAFRAIMCSDGGEMTDTAEEFEKYANNLQDQSKAAGAVNVLFRISCAGWRMKAKWRFTGPFGGNTSFPILFIANSADNVTPLRSARNNAKGFNESVVLIQDSFGHTSLAAPSLCTATHIQNYFQNGTLPNPETVCKGDLYPFDDIHTFNTKDGQEEMSAALLELMRASMPQPEV